MAQSAAYFRTECATFDWVTSYFYNFIMWLTFAWVFHLLRPALKGSDLSASFKVFGLMWLFFASVSAIYMNHYSHRRDFYFWNILDAALMFALVARGNSILYRRVMGPSAAAARATIY